MSRRLMAKYYNAPIIIRYSVGSGSSSLSVKDKTEWATEGVENRLDSVKVKLMEKIINIFLLRRKKTCEIMLYLNAKEVMKVFKFLHSKLVRKIRDKGLEKLGGIAS